jgi:hypothetical protein
LFISVYPTVAALCCAMLHAQVGDLLAEVGLLLRNGLQCVRMLLWLRFMGNSRGRSTSFQLEVGDPELTEQDFEFGESDAMLGSRHMSASSKKGTPEKVRSDQILVPPTASDASISSSNNESNTGRRGLVSRQRVGDDLRLPSATAQREVELQIVVTAPSGRSRSSSRSGI